MESKPPMAHCPTFRRLIRLMIWSLPGPERRLAYVSPMAPGSTPTVKGWFSAMQFRRFFASICPGTGSMRQVSPGKRAWAARPSTAPATVKPTASPTASCELNPFAASASTCAANRSSDGSAQTGGGDHHLSRRAQLECRTKPTIAPAMLPAPTLMHARLARAAIAANRASGQSIAIDQRG